MNQKKAESFSDLHKCLQSTVLDLIILVSKAILLMKDAAVKQPGFAHDQTAQMRATRDALNLKKIH